MRCKPGIMARIVSGAFDKAGPNINKIVEVVKFVGNHPEFGPTWYCICKENLITEYGGVSHDADIADDWLEPIEPDTPLKVKEDQLETV